MKRFLNFFVSTLLIFCLIFFSSCGSISNVIEKKHLFDFTTDAQISYKDYDLLTCKIKSVKDGPLTLDITKPVLLSGLSLVCENEGMTVKLGNLSYEADLKRFPQLSFGNDLRKSLISAGESTQIIKNEDGTFLIKVQLESCHAELLLEKETYYPIRLVIPEDELTVSFSNFTPTQNQ